jgi:molybdopterin converting factor small subunit
MKVKVLLFAGVREILHEKYININLVKDNTIQELINIIKYSYPSIEDLLDSSVISVNKSIVTDYSSELHSSDEIAIIPPISSG